MNNFSASIEKKISALQNKIDSLSGNYLTNTWKRQQEQKWRDTQIERLRLQKQVLEYLAEVDGCQDLTELEKALLNGTFYDAMRHFSASKQYAAEHPGYRYSPEFPTREDAMEKRFLKAGIHDTSELLLAIAAFDDLMHKATIPPDPNAARIRDLTFKARLAQRGDIQFTPQKVSSQLISITGIDASCRVLEPEAGIGAIADEAKKISSHVDCIEPVYDFRELLKLKGHSLIGDDLLTCEPQPVYDAVLMNPPFSDECRHIRYAYDFLKPGGKLAAVCCVRMLESDNKKYTEFREWLSGQRFRFENVIEKFEMTGTNTKILVIEKPASAA